MSAGLSELIEGRELLWNLTLRELRGKYKRSVLGWAWSMLNPLSTMLIYSIVFGVLLKVQTTKGNPSGVNNFMFFLTCALLPWNFTSTGIMATLPQLVGNANLIKKVYFPREYIVGASVFSWLYSFMIELSVLMVAFVFIGHVTFQWIPVLICLMLLQTFLVMGIGLALSVLNVYFRDIQHFAGIFMQVWFYLTPIVYPMEARDEAGKLVRAYIPQTAHLLGVDVPIRTIYKLNPMVEFVEAYRNILYDGKLPGMQAILYCVCSTVVVLVAGYAIFQRLEPRLAEEV